MRHLLRLLSGAALLTLLPWSAASAQTAGGWSLSAYCVPQVVQV